MLSRTSASAVVLKRFSENNVKSILDIITDQLIPPLILPYIPGVIVVTGVIIFSIQPPLVKHASWSYGVCLVNGLLFLGVGCGLLTVAVMSHKKDLQALAVMESAHMGNARY